MVAVLLAAHAILAAITPLCVRRWGSRAFWLAALAPLATTGWLIAQLPTVRAGGEVLASYPWAPGLALDLTFRLDALAAVLLALAGGVGVLVLVYSRWYFGADSPALPRVAGVLVAFAGAMTGLVLADNLLVLYVCWELTTVCSFLLIGQADTDEDSRRSATQSLLVTTGLGLPMLLGFIILGEAAGTYQISSLLDDPPRGPAATVAIVLVLAGALAKAAQVPLHPWLPAAMVAGTPVSAYLHAAAMVKAGPYLVARFAPGFADSGPWVPLVVTVGLVSMIVGGWRALRQDDLKLLLAYGTVSQLGFLIVLFGAGTQTAALAGMAMILAHGLFKAPLFLVVGVIDHQAHTRRISELSGLASRMPGMFALAIAATASMIGLPPFLGFIGKEGALDAFLPEHAPWAASPVVLAGIAIGSVLTVGYSLRFLHGGFGGAPPGSGQAGRLSRPPADAVAGIATPAVAGLVAGLAPTVVDELGHAYAGVLPHVGPAYELKLWHGITPALGLSAAIVLGGVVVHLGRGWLAAARARVGEIPTAQRAQERLADRTVAAAMELTGRTQVGSLPVYLVVIVATVVAVPGTALVLGAIRDEIGPSVTGGLALWDQPLQVLLGAITLAAAIAAATTSRRLSAVLFLAVSGYAVGGLFIVHGAPDLALTLILVDTLTLIMLALVLRRMPVELPQRRSRPLAVTALVLSGLVGGLVAILLISTTAARTGSRLAADYIPASEHIGAHNVVNAILTDFRALDTLGEATVLLIAAVGVASIVHSTRAHEVPGSETPTDPDPSRESASETERPWLQRPSQPPYAGRTIFLEVVTRVLTPVVLLFSVYLLFAGHHHPGGGFAGGLVAGMAFVLRYVSGGASELAAATRLASRTLLGAGLVLATVVGIAPWFVGGELLEATMLTADLPVVGHVEFATNLIFDIGVYLIVVGLVRMLLDTLAVRLEAPEADAPGAEEATGMPAESTSTADVLPERRDR